MAAALLLGGIAAPALADGFNGTISSSNNIGVVSPNEYNVFGTEAVINWDATATSAAQTNVDFLPVGQTVTFHDFVASSSGDFTVLNRVSPTFSGGVIPATISLSGTVNSTVNGVQGGNIWFYSPYGIIANGTSQFSVGGLLLTTSDIQLNGNNGLYLDQSNGKQIGFQQAAQPGSFVRIMPGAQINASNDTLNDAYVGIFAPRIEQGGTISSKGMTALAAGEGGSITFNAGLVSIAIDVGTGDPNGIVHTGTTGGPASADGERKTIAMVAMSKNAALTMLLSGSVGYDPAAAGVPDGGAVELYAGRTLDADVVTPDPGRLVVSGPANASTGTITIGNTAFSSALEALSTGAIDVAPVYTSVNSPGLVDFQQNARLVAGGSIDQTAAAGERIRAGDSLFLAPMLRRTGEDVTLTVTGDAANVITPGRIDVTNFLSIIADGAPDLSGASANVGADGQGGDVKISVAAGSLTAAQGIYITADGIGTDGFQTGGTGTGGTIDIGVSNKGTISGSGLFAAARGSGGNAFSSVSPASGGAGAGGELTIHDDDGTLQFGDVTGIAEAQGGGGSDVAGGATGGRAEVRITGGSQTWNALRLSAAASGGNSTATIGSVSTQADGVLLAVSGTGGLTAASVSLDNSAQINAGGSAAYSAQAGDADVQVSGGAALTVTGSLTIRADAGLPNDPPSPNGAFAPAMSAGRASVLADGGAISAGEIDLSASATAIGAGTTGATATGGSALLGAINGGSVSVTGTTVTTIRAEAYGAVGPAPGDAQGGTARVYADNGTISAPAGLAISASALTGGAHYVNQLSGTGFNATGGTATAELLAGGGTITVGTLAVYAKGEASVAQEPDGTGDLAGFSPGNIAGIDGNGGTGTGGTAQINVAGGTLTAGSLRVRAYGVGGGSDVAPAATPYQSGSGIGGSALFTQTGGTVGSSTLDLGASGLGGSFEGSETSSTAFSSGGTASGGTARASLSGGTTSLTGALTLAATALGGAGMNSSTSGNGGAGGSGDNTAGLAELLMPLGSTASLTAASLTVDAGALGGAGGAASGFSSGGTAGNGAAASGGTARVSLADGAINVPGAVTITADTTGGNGLAGGTGTGGIAAFALTDSLAAPSTQRSLGSLVLTANGVGGTAASGIAGATSFTARAGRPASALTIVGDFLAQANGDVFPAGDGFTGNFGTVPVVVGGNALIDTGRDVNATTLAGGGLSVTGTLDIFGRAIATSGPGVLGAGGNVQVIGQTSINLGGLSSGGTTLLVAQDTLSAAYGPITVASLSSTGVVTANSSSFSAVSPGALTFAPSFAVTGGFSVQTAGNLGVAAIDAAGALSLVSTGGALNLTGQQDGNSIVLGANGNIAASAPLISATTLAATAGGTFTSTLGITVPGATSIDAAGGITIPTLTSGAATLLRAAGGAISVPQLLSAGPVTLLARTAAIGSTGALTFASATTTAGDLSLTTAGNLVVTNADATGALTLTSTGGSLQSAGLIRSTGNTALSASGNIGLAAVNSGGTTSLTSTGGTVGVTGLSSTGAVTASGTAVTIAGPGALTFAPSTSTSGGFNVQAGTITAGTINAAGPLSLVSTGGALNLTGQQSGSSIVLGANGNIAASAPLVSATTLAATAGGAFTSTLGITVPGATSIDAAGGITIPSLTSGAATLLRAAGGAISVPQLLSTGPVTLLARTAAIGSNGALTFASAITTAGDLSFTTAGNLVAANADATGALTLTSTSGSVQSTGLLRSTGAATIDGTTGISVASLSTGAATLLRSASGTITVPQLASTGPITLLARTAAIGSTGALTFASATTTAGNLSISAAGNLAVTNADVTGALALGSTGGSLQSTGLLRSTGNAAFSASGNIGLAAVTSGGTTSLSSTGGTVGVTGLASTGLVTANGTGVVIGGTGSLAFAPSSASAGNFTVYAPGDLTFGNVGASGTLTVQAGGAAVFNGQANGGAIAVSSADIRIGATARLGQRGVTSAITLTNTAPGAGTAIGGSAAAAGWSLDAAEAMRLFADQSIAVVVPAQAAAPADVVIAAFAPGFGPAANIGSGGTLSVTTSGRIRVTGAVAPVMSGNTDTVSLTAGQRIDVVTDTGSIVLRNPAGGLSGTLRMTAPTVRVASAAALTALDTVATLDLASQRLAENDGIISDVGKIQANALVFTVAASTLYIQNTGTDSEVPNRRGFTANSLSIDGLNGASPSFAINGVLLDAAGLQVTGAATAPLISVNGVLASAGGRFNPASTVNGCTVGIGCTVPVQTIAPPYETIEQLVAVLRPGAGRDALLNLPLVQYGETPLLNSPPLIDEPVTGVGNDDLWLRRCGADKDCTE